MGARNPTYDSAKTANPAHDEQMPELIAKANQAILEARWLRRQGRALRSEAAVLVSELGARIVRSHATENERSQTSDESRSSAPATFP